MNLCHSLSMEEHIKDNASFVFGKLSSIGAACFCTAATFLGYGAHQPSSAHGVSASHADSTRLFHCKMKMLIGKSPI
jgi:hypothetical protein